MPGTVVAIHVKAGDSVAPGAALLTLEAMKMETVVRSPKSGQIKEIPVSSKATVQSGDLLAVIG